MNEAVAEVLLPEVSVWVARAVAPSEKVTEPVGNPEVVEALATEAVKMTDWP